MIRDSFQGLDKTMLTRKSDTFYSIFVRTEPDDDSNQYSMEEATERAKRLAKRMPHYEYFVMKTVSKCQP
jgi:hypothetical protein